MSHALPLPLPEQYKLLDEDKVAEAIRQFLGGDTTRLGELFSITQDEYLEWAIKRPVREDGWLRTSRSSQDGIYFLNEFGSSWKIYQQERGAILWMEIFSNYEEARRYLEIDYGLGRHLRRGR